MEIGGCTFLVFLREKDERKKRSMEREKVARVSETSLLIQSHIVTGCLQQDIYLSVLEM